jgi:multidrug efflux pump subunit AcrA (membrane-fusion protein)
MKRRNLWIGLVVIMIAALGLSACGQEPTQEKIEPVELVDQGDGRNLVILTEKAAERLDIQTDTVREEQVLVTRSYGGEVTEASAGSGAMVMVSLTTEEMGMVDADVPALVFPLDGDDAEDSDEDEGFMAELDELPGMDDAEDNGVTTLYYLVKDSEAGLVTGQRLIVELSLKGDDGPQLVVPVASLIYGLNGETWIYISPEHLQFLRVPVVVDYIIGDMVVLVDGPNAGTKVVIVGVPELHGADTGVGK